MAKPTTPKKCAHPPCECIPADGSKYCSAHCEGAGEVPELLCRCGHPDCTAEATKA